jgi:hypothetical protein
MAHGDCKAIEGGLSVNVTQQAPAICNCYFGDWVNMHTVEQVTAAQAPRT